MEDGYYELPELDLGDIDEWFSQDTPGSKAVEIASLATCQAIEVEARTAVGELGGSGQRTPNALGERRGSVLAELPTASLTLQPRSDLAQHAECRPIALGKPCCGDNLVRPRQRP